MRPSPLARRAGSSAWVTRSRPSTLTSYIQRHSSGSASATGDIPNAPPASLTSTCSESPTASANPATDSGEVTSQVTAVPPISRASSSIRSVRRAAHTTAYPSWASARAVAAPIPLEAPVTTAVRRFMTTILPGRITVRTRDRRRTAPGWHTGVPMGRHVDAAGPLIGVRRTAQLCGLVGGAAWVIGYVVDPGGGAAATLLWGGALLLTVALVSLGARLVKSDVVPLRLFVAVALPTLVWGVFLLLG